MPETTFEVVYDGPALDDGRIPVRDLAPALLALGDLFAEARKVAYPDMPAVSLEIQATREGSFGVELILQAADGVWEQIVNTFGSEDATALVQLKELIVGGAAIGYFGYRKWRRGRAVRKQEAVEGGSTRITVEDGDSIIVRHEIVVLDENGRVRKHAQSVVRPLGAQDVERLDFKSGGDVVESLGKSDIPSFAPPAVDPDKPDEVTEQVLEGALVEIVQPTITKDDYKWRLTMGGGSSFQADIEDQEYIRRILMHEQQFLAGDRLRCTLRIVQTESGDKLTTEYAVTDVTEHIKAEPQIPLDDTGEAA